MKDYYQILSISPRDDLTAIRGAYRRLVRELHPDVNDDPVDHQRFRDVAEAYNILADSKARRKYDAARLFRMTLPLDRLFTLVENPHNRARIAAKIAAGIYRLSRPAKKSVSFDGRDLQLNRQISFSDSYTGTVLDLVYERAVRCAACEGTGFDSPVPCPACHGRGHILFSGIPGLSKRCPSCDGLAVSGKGPCQNCEGIGLVTIKQKLSIQVPAGIADQTRLRLQGKGEQGRFGGKDGDLSVRIKTDHSLHYGREKANLTAVKEVPLAVAVNGGVVSFLMPGGKEIEVDVPVNSYTGQHVLVKGAGFASTSRGEPGDLRLKVDVSLPVELTTKERNIAMEWLDQARRQRGNVSPAIQKEINRIIRMQS